MAHLKGAWCDSPWQGVGVTDLTFVQKCIEMHQNVAFPGIKFQNFLTKTPLIVRRGTPLPLPNLQELPLLNHERESANDLYHLYINRDIELDYHSVIEEFSKFNRRLSFV